MAYGWLTPGYPPARRFYTRQLLIPATAEFLALVNGALIELCKVYNWEQDGEMTPAETAEYFLDMWQAYTKNVNEPPDWTNSEDVDGEPEQPWYDELADWIITGFLAVTFTPQAAIVYQSTVPRLRVAFRTGDIGALFRVLINGVEVWSGDSYSPITDLIEQVFDMSAETSPYTVRVEHNGIGGGFGSEAKLEFVRQGAVADMVATILRADPEGCGVQWSIDNGEQWATVDLSECIGTIADDRIQQAIEDGTIPRGGQDPESPPAPEECKTYRVKLAANSAWVCPSPVNAGGTVQIANATGSWNDGSGLGALGPWFCPDGNSYGLGTCGDDGAVNAGDPLPTTFHMAIVAYCEGWFDPATMLTVPNGVSNAQLTIQANDATISDNLGEVEFDVTVCTASSTLHCYEWDFTAGKSGWDNYPNPINGVPYGVYVADYGFRTDGALVQWVRSTAAWVGLSISAVEIDYTNDAVGGVNNLSLWSNAGLLWTEALDATSGAHTLHKDWETTWQAGHYPWINDGVVSGSATINKLRLYFTYPGNPFGEDNCT
jgi:hypothetical protein